MLLNYAAQQSQQNMPYTVDEVLAEIQEQSAPKKSWSKNFFIFLISLLIFFRLGLFQNGTANIVIIVVVILIHEIGHFIGMKLFGYRNIQMFFIPFFGAAVAGQSDSVPAYKKAIITLLGPLPGIILGTICLVIYAKTNTQIYMQLATMFLIINCFNLLPFFPLDGGRLFNEILFCRNRYIELFSRIIASLALVAIGLFLQAWLIAIFGLLTLLAVSWSFRIAGIAKDIKNAIALNNSAEGNENEPLDERTIYEIIINRLHKAFKAKLDLKKMASFTKDTFEKIHIRPPGAWATTALIGLYLFSVILSFASIAGTFVLKAGNGDWTETRIVESPLPNGQIQYTEQIYVFGDLTTELETSPDQLLYHGQSISYYPDGKISKQGYWNNGKWDGQWKYYDLEGNLTMVNVFDNGKFVSHSELEGDQWINKTWDQLSYLAKKAFTEHENAQPKGPKNPETIDQTAK